GSHRRRRLDWSERDDPQRGAHRGRSVHRGRFAGDARRAAAGPGARESRPNHWRSPMNPDRRLTWDWYDGVVPENVLIDEQAYLESTYSFQLFRSRVPSAVKVGRGSSVYLGVMFDLGPKARVELGDYVLMNGARLVCDSE